MEELATLLAVVPFNPGILAVVEAGKCVGDNLERLRFLSHGDNVAGLYMI